MIQAVYRDPSYYLIFLCLKIREGGGGRKVLWVGLVWNMHHELNILSSMMSAWSTAWNKLNECQHMRSAFSYAYAFNKCLLINHQQCTLPLYQCFHTVNEWAVNCDIHLLRKLSTIDHRCLSVFVINFISYTKHWNYYYFSRWAYGKADSWSCGHLWGFYKRYSVSFSMFKHACLHWICLYERKTFKAPIR